MKLVFQPEEAGKLKTFKGKGCSTCNNTGYKGRIGLYEVMEVTDEIRELILIGASALELRKKAIEDGMITLRESGLYKIRAGVTTSKKLSARRWPRETKGSKPMLRTIALSLLILVSVVTMLPFAESAAHGIRQSVACNADTIVVTLARGGAGIAALTTCSAGRIATSSFSRRSLPATHNAAPAWTAPVLSQLPNGWNALPAAANGEMRFRASSLRNRRPGRAHSCRAAVSPTRLTSRRKNAGKCLVVFHSQTCAASSSTR